MHLRPTTGARQGKVADAPVQPAAPLILFDVLPEVIVVLRRNVLEGHFAMVVCLHGQQGLDHAAALRLRPEYRVWWRRKT